MADLFVSLVSISPKVSQVAPVVPLATSADGQDITGLPANIQTIKVTAPGGQSK